MGSPFFGGANHQENYNILDNDFPSYKMGRHHSYVCWKGTGQERSQTLKILQNNLTGANQ